MTNNNFPAQLNDLQAPNPQPTIPFIQPVVKIIIRRPFIVHYSLSSAKTLELFFFSINYTHLSLIINSVKEKTVAMVNIYQKPVIP